jgi:hypothetical protein
MILKCKICGNEWEGLDAAVEADAVDFPTFERIDDIDTDELDAEFDSGCPHGNSLSK